MRGRVTEFDDPRGYGTVTADDGATYFFHCTAMADGTRTIETGVRVTFEIRPGHAGRWEATNIRDVGSFVA